MRGILIFGSAVILAAASFVTIEGNAATAQKPSTASGETAPNGSSNSASNSASGGTPVNAPSNNAASKPQDPAVVAPPSSQNVESSVTTGAAAPATTPAAAPAGNSAGNSTASLPAAIPEKKRAIRGEFYSLSSIPKSSLNNASGAPSSSNFLGIKYAFQGGRSISIRQPFTYSFPKVGAQGQAKVSDLYLNFAQSGLASFAGDGSITGSIRVYLPTGESSRFITKTNGSLMGWFIASKPFGKIDVSYHVLPSWFNQTQNSYVTSKGDLKANKDFAINHFVDVSYSLSEKLSISQSIGTDNAWYKGIPETGVTREHSLSMMTSLSFAPVPQLTILTGLSNDIDIYEPKQSFELMRDDELTAMLLISASI
jgi:hypothetical protein